MSTMRFGRSSVGRRKFPMELSKTMGGTKNSMLSVSEQRPGRSRRANSRTSRVQRHYTVYHGRHTLEKQCLRRTMLSLGLQYSANKLLEACRISRYIVLSRASRRFLQFAMFTTDGGACVAMITLSGSSSLVFNFACQLCFVHF